MKTARIIARAFALSVIASAASAAPITIGSDNFGDVNTASGTTVDFGGSGIPTDPFAWSSFTDDAGNELILGLGTHGRFSNPAVTTSAPNIYGATAGFNDGMPGETDGPATLGTTWNFAWFMELVPAQGQTTLADLGIKLLFDFDPGKGTDTADHGVVDISASLAAAPAGTANMFVNQGSQNLAFSFLATDFPPFISSPALASFDPFAPGEFTFALTSELGSVGVAMNVAPVPLPATLPLLLGALGLGGFLSLRRKKRSV